jgi:uncharacterized membrane protein
MYCEDVFRFSLWWIFPIVMMIMWFLMMRRSRRSMMCGFTDRDKSDMRMSASDSAEDILDKRYALGKLSKEEYEEKKRTLTKEKEECLDC